jgi:hypothetical protein
MNAQECAQLLSGGGGSLSPTVIEAPSQWAGDWPL